MAKSINWESVIPNFREGDVITPFEKTYQELKTVDYIVDGGIDHYCPLRTYASVKRGDSRKVGVYNERGEVIIPEEFDECKAQIHHSNGFYCTAISVKKGELLGVYNEDGEMIVPVQFKRICLGDFLIVVEDENEMVGAYTYDGKKFLDCQYDKITVYGSLDKGCGIVLICQGALYGVLSENGEEIIPMNYSCILRKAGQEELFEVFREDEASGNKFTGCFNRDGNVIIPCEFKSYSHMFIADVNFSEIRVKKHDGLIGIYSEEGKEIVPPKYTQIEYVFKYAIATAGENSLAVYTLDGECLFEMQISR